jgi:pilus assembly protein CpaC
MKESKKSIYVWLSTTLIISCFVLLSIYGPCQAAAQTTKTTTEQGKISIVAGQSRVLQAPWPTIRVSVTDPKIADVQILTPTQILLQGVKVGSTDLILWNKDETEIWQLTVSVTLDVATHQQKLDKMFPNCELELDQSGTVLLVKGLLRNVNQAEKLREYLEKTGIEYLDMTSVAGLQQVQLEVRVAEVSRTAIRALGMNIYNQGHDNFFGNYFFGVQPGSSTGRGGSELGLTGLAAMTASPVTVFAGFGNDWRVFIQALAENQYLRVLANPTLVALSGEEASFLAGGEFPIPVPQSSGSGGAGGTTITIEYKKFGVQLVFRPIVLGDGTIQLKVAPEVSELTTVGSVTLDNFVVPALNTRTFETTLELKSGQTFAMAGLIKKNDTAINSRVPGLGDLPVLGALFRSVRYTRGETEMVVLVTATLVEPLNLAETPPLPGFMDDEPNDWELYIEGKIDGTYLPKVNSADAEWMRQMGLDKLIGPGAWDYYDNPATPSKADTKPVETINKQSSYNYYQSDVSEDSKVSPGIENGLNSFIYITDLKE